MISHNQGSCVLFRVEYKLRSFPVILQPIANCSSLGHSTSSNANKQTVTAHSERGGQRRKTLTAGRGRSQTCHEGTRKGKKRTQGAERSSK